MHACLRTSLCENRRENLQPRAANYRRNIAFSSPYQLTPSCLGFPSCCCVTRCRARLTRTKKPKSRLVERNVFSELSPKCETCVRKQLISQTIDADSEDKGVTILQTPGFSRSLDEVVLRESIEFAVMRVTRDVASSRTTTTTIESRCVASRRRGVGEVIENIEGRRVIAPTRSIDASIALNNTSGLYAFAAEYEKYVADNSHVDGCTHDEAFMSF